MAITSDLLVTNQSQKEVTANGLFTAMAQASLFGVRISTTSGLVVGYFGGYMLVDGVLTSIANGTVTLTASNTNYIEATRAGVVSANTTGFTAGRIPLYVAVTTGSTVTSYADERDFSVPRYITQDASFAVTTADVTLTAAQARARYLTTTGTLTGNRNVIVPNNGEWIVYNSCAGAFTLTVKTSGGSGIVIGAGKRAIVYADSTNVVRVTADV